LMYYLLGWMVGDASKSFYKSHTLARFELQLSRKHMQNLRLGNFVIDSISNLGVPCGRIKDSPPRSRDKFGQYRWMSYFLETFAWLYTSCLGLKPDELTSYAPVKMDWLLTAPREARIWFLRGIADSDGTVNVRNRTVDLVSEPNSGLLVALFHSVGISAGTWVSKGVGVVSIPVPRAMELSIFNPKVETHRGKLLRRLANAKTYQGRWPAWLHCKVTRLLLQGESVTHIRDRLLWEDNTYVTLRTLGLRTPKKESQRRDSDAGPRAYEAPKLPVGSALPG